MKRFHFSKRWGLAAMGLPFAAWAAGEGPVTFDSRVEAGRRVVVTGSVVTLGAGVVMGPGAELVVRATEGVVFTPGMDVRDGSLDMHVGSAPLAKPAALSGSPEAFSASLRQTSQSLMLRYALPEAGRVGLRILDAQGKTVFKTSLRSPAGRHEAALRFAPKRSGLYLVRAEFGGKSILQRTMMTAR